MKQEKYIGYLILETMSRGEGGHSSKSASALETARFDCPLLLDIALRCYRRFRKARRLSGGL